MSADSLIEACYASIKYENAKRNLRIAKKRLKTLQEEYDSHFILLP